jgi:uncharacterized OsmC-like protein
MQRQTDASVSEGTLSTLYRIAPETARARHYASTTDRNPADPYRATVLIGEDEADLLPFGAELALGGPRGAASPSDLLCAALAASQDSAIRLAAARHRVRIEGLNVEVSGWMDARGALGVNAGVPVGFQTLLSTIRVEVATGTDAEEVRRMLVDAERTCIVLATLRRAVPVYTRIEHSARAAPGPDERERLALAA